MKFAVITPVEHIKKAKHYFECSAYVREVNIWSKYAQTEVCVFPSHMETFGLVAPEAAAMQKAVVFTNKGPGPEIISQMRKEARKASLGRFDVKALVQKNIRFYEEILNS